MTQIVDSGNIVRFLFNLSDENECLNAFTRALGISEKQETSIPTIQNRTDINVNLKIFVDQRFNVKSISVCINHLLSLMGLDYVDLIICDITPDVDLEKRKNIWMELETCLHQGLVQKLGISNYTKEQLVSLLSYAKTKPTLFETDQFCCNVGNNENELITIIKLEEIRMSPTPKTDKFVNNIFSKETYQQSLSGTKYQNVSVDWVAKYSVIRVANTTVVNLGYAFGISED